MKNKIALCLATWFGSGRIPSIVGSAMGATYGSFLALPLCFLVLVFGLKFWFLTTILIFALGVWSVPIAESSLGPQVDNRGMLRERDQNQIVIDEVLGMLIAITPLFWVSFSSLLMLFFWLVVTFFLFRFFDIKKRFAFGAKYFDQIPNAYGVMLDDVVAGL
jgi:phosphatidylglycerophosphatase A